MSDEKDEKIKKLEERIKKLEERDTSEDPSYDLKGAQELLEIELKIAAALGDRNTMFRKANALYAEMKKEGIAFEEVLDGNNEKVKEFAEKTGISVEEVRKLIEMQQDLGEVGMEAYDTMKSGAEDAAVKMGLVSKKADSILGGIIKIGKMAASPQGLKGMALAIKDTLKPSRIAASLLLKIAEATFDAFMAADRATASFAKQTGAGRMMTEQIFNLGTKYRDLGISIEEAGNANTVLFKTFAGFNSLNQQQQDSLGKIAVAFDKFGVGMQNAGIISQDFIKSFGMNVNEAVDATTSLATSAIALDQDMASFVKGFQNANKVLAVYGKKSVKIFNNVAAAARAAGVETDTLLGLAGKFDTFSESAETAGKLNSILGTQMSAMDLIGLQEDQRIEYILRNIQASGQQFKQMDKFTRLAIANAAGIKDMNEANKIFGMSFGKYKQYQEKLKAQEKSQKELNERMEKAKTIMDDLKMVMLMLALDAGPFIDAIKEITEDFATFMQGLTQSEAKMYLMGAAFVFLLPALGALVNVLGIFSFILKPIAIKMGALMAKMLAKIPILSALTAAQTTNNAATKTSNKLATSSIIKFRMMAKAVMFMGVGIGIAAAGVSLLVLQLGKLSGEQMIQVTGAILVLGLALAGFIALMVMLAPKAAIASAGLAALGSAMLIISIAIAIMAVGMSILVGTIAELGEKGAAAVGVFYSLTSATFALAGATAALGNPLSLLGMLALMGAMNKLIELSLALQNISANVSNVVISMGDMAVDIKDSVDKFALLANADFFMVMKGLSKGMNDFKSSLKLESEQGIQVQHTLENLALIATGTSANLLSGTKGTEIVSALNRIARKEENKIIRVEVTKEAIEKMLRDGYFEIRQ